MSDAEQKSAQGPSPPCPLEPLPQQGHGADHTSASDDARGDEVKSPTKAEVLHKLNQLPGAIALGFLPPARANAIRGVFGTMLAHLGESTTVGVATVTDADVLTIMRQNPEMLKIIGPLLTPDQRALVIREASHD